MVEFFNITNIHLYIAILLSVFNGFALCMESYKFMQIIQLSGYHLREYFNWLRNTRAKYFVRLVMLTLLSCSAILVTNVIFRIIPEPYQDYISYLGLVFYFLFSAFFIKVMHEAPKKTPLKWTARVKRSNAILFILSAVISFVLIAVSNMYFGIFRFGVIGLTPLLLPLLVPFAHFILKPLEYRIRKNYLKKATIKLKQYPKLIKIGITGSYGKTTVKNILETILSEKYSVCATPLNFNTPMGFTRTILEKLMPINQVFIAEMGARQRGDIQELCELVQPQYGILTTIGPQHMTTFGSLENVQRTKAELVNYLEKDGFCVFNIDNSLSKELMDKTTGKKGCISLENNHADIWASNIKATENGTSFTLHCNKKEYKCATKLLGVQNISNILMCVALALKLDLTMDQILDGIDKIKPIEHRLQLVQAPNDVLILDDTYNASIDGSQRALEVLNMFNKRNKIVITPGLVELGSIEHLSNYEFGKNIAKVANIVIIVNQTNLIAIKQGLLDSGFDEQNIYTVNDVATAKKKLEEILKNGDVILWENDLPDNYT